MASNQISLKTIAGVIVGLLSGLIVKSIFWPNDHQVDPSLLRYLSLPGTIYIRVFMLLITPLLVTSLSTSECSIHSKVISVQRTFLLIILGSL